MNKATKSISQILRDNICTVFNLLNLMIAIALAFVGAWKNMFFILIILINTVVGIVQEIKAKKQVERLSLLSQPTAKILRDNKEYKVSVENVKKGDCLLFESGSVICTDSILRSGSLEVNESNLTGESEPVIKKSEDKLMSGSTVVSGKCTATAVCDSSECFASKMVDEVKKTRQSKSELLSSMKKVTRLTGFFIVPIGILMLIQAVFLRNEPIDLAVVSTSAGLLGMLPKGLVLLISIGLAAGVVRLSKKNVLVRELHSLENLAHCDVVCLDKTGTLTDGKLAVCDVTTSVDNVEFVKLMEAYINGTDDTNSTYNALKEYFKSYIKKINQKYSVVSSVAFSSERKYSSVTFDNGKTFVIGAPEKLCKTVPENIKKLMADGKRVIFAGLCNNQSDLQNVEVVGTIVISDSVRKNARETINYFYNQEVDVKIISGDNPSTVAAVAKSSGVKNYDKFVDMSLVPDDSVEKIADKYTVFGRVTPKQKQLIISALQKKGHKVAMTGDGVNDLLAMRQADCSAAMGNGSDAAKQTAQLVLLDSDFAVLKNVISEGRRVVNNITKSAGVFFIKTIYSVLLSILCLLLNIDFPFIPIQITLIDAVIEGFPAFFMSFEENDTKIRGSFLNSAIASALPNSIAIFVCCFISYIVSPKLGIGSEQSCLIMYLAVGVISLIGVAKASMPFNPFRLSLTVISALGFFGAVIIFSNLLQLPTLSVGSLPLLGIITVIGILITAFLKIPDLNKNKRKLCMSEK